MLPPMSDEARKGNTPLTWVLTAVVLAIGATKAWSVLTVPAAPPPTSADVAVASDGYSMLFEEDLGDLRQLRWWSVREARDGDERTPYEGRLTLYFSDQVQQSYPVVEGKVEVQPHELQLLELAASKKLGVEWDGHPRRDVPFAWLEKLASPEVLEQQAGPTATRVLVRNRSLTPMTVRVRGGWRADKRWLDDPARNEASATVRDVLIAPGGTQSVELSYSEGPPGSTLTDPIVRPIF
jgi:hypothetical protein